MLYSTAARISEVVSLNRANVGNGRASYATIVGKGNKAATLASLADKAATSRVNFDLDRDQHTKLKVYAAKQGKTVKEVLTELVAQLPE